MKRNEFARNLAAGTYDLVVLDVLRAGPSYGYAIVKYIFERSKHTLKWHEGTLYPVLHRLERRGLLESQWHTPKHGRHRCYYHLTAKGRRAWTDQRSQWRTFSQTINQLLSD